MPAAPAPALAGVTGPVPHYSGAAVVTGSLLFVLLLAVTLAFLRRRR